MHLGTKGRVAFVGASSSGLGLPLAEPPAAKGVSLAICAGVEKALCAAGRRARGLFGVKVLHQPLDVTAIEAVTKFMGETRNRVQAVNIHVTNGGEPPAGGVEDFPLQDCRQAPESVFLSTSC